MRSGRFYARVESEFKAYCHACHHRKRANRMERNWFQEFDELTRDVSGSDNNTFAHNLQRWLDLLDGYPSFSRHFKDWEFNADFEPWLKEMETGTSPTVGGNSLRWPRHKLSRLGMQLVLFRALASGAVVLPFFALKHFRVDVTAHNYAEAISKQLFVPFSNELRRELQSQSDTNGDDASLDTAPASDREVPLDHNSHEYQAIVSALDRIATAIERKNEYPEREKKERHLAELTAGRTLLKPKSVRTAAILGTLGATLLWLAKTFAAEEIGNLADLIWKLLVSLLGQ